MIVPWGAIERIVADGDDRVGDGHAGQAVAVIERPVANGGNRVADGRVRQATTILEFVSFFLSVIYILKGGKVNVEILWIVKKMNI